MAHDCSDGRQGSKHRRVDPPSGLQRGRQGHGTPKYTQTSDRTSGVTRSASAGTDENEVRPAVSRLITALRTN